MPLHHLMTTVGAPTRAIAWLDLHFNRGRQQDAAGLLGGFSLAATGRITDLTIVQLAGVAVSIATILGIVSREWRGWKFKSPK